MSSNLKAVVKSTAMDPGMLEYTLAKAALSLGSGSNDGVRYEL